MGWAMGWRTFGAGTGEETESPGQEPSQTGVWERENLERVQAGERSGTRLNHSADELLITVGLR